MVNVKKTKLGFSLAEALVSMLVMSVFFLGTSKVITSKPKKELQLNRHGYFECYYDNGVLKEKRTDGSYAGVPTNAVGNVCRMTPPSGIAFILIYAYINGRFYVSTEPQFSSDATDTEITIGGSELYSFPFLYMEGYLYGDENPLPPNTNIDELKNFFKSCYPSSSIYEKLQGATYYGGPAIFIGW